MDDLPRLLNPRGGYIQNANNPPWFVSLRDPIDPRTYPRYLERGALALRPQLALDLLETRETFSVNDVIDLKFNTRMLLAERVKPALIDALKAAPSPSADVRAGLTALEAWDGRVSAGSRGAVLFQRFWDAYAAEVRQPFAVAWDAKQPATTPHGIADPAAAVRHLEAAVRATRETYGTETVAWGDANRFRFGTIDLPGEGSVGTYGCYRVMRFDAATATTEGGPGKPGEKARVAGNPGGGRSLVGFGDAWILVVDFSQPVTGWSVLAYGQTTAPDSPHSRDQIGTFASHRLRRAWFTPAEIAAHTERTYRPGSR